MKPLQKVMEINRKICMLGSFGLGKTSLVRRYVYNLFDEKYLTIIGVQISQKLLSRRREGDTFTCARWVRTARFDTRCVGNDGRKV